jgi:hypothetical protein
MEIPFCEWLARTLNGSWPTPLTPSLNNHPNFDTAIMGLPRARRRARLLSS